MDTLILALRVLLSLAVVLGLLWVIQRRVSRGVRVARTTKPVTVVSRQGIGQKASVVVVEHAGKRYLLGVTEHAVSVLDADLVPVDAVPAFSRSMADAASAGIASAGIANASEEPTPAPVPMLRPRRDRGGYSANSSGRMAGSVLSAATWKQAAEFARQGR
ncbi:MAG TPA: flagellar biosynthetic protein FliO [Microbacteriaceae bacterium]|nr:flagellar biosynthetic protein FliO [Microbacteriaceae bacterium]